MPIIGLPANCSNGLAIDVGNGADGIAAERVVRLPQGAFRAASNLQSDSGNSDQLPRIELQCASNRQAAEFNIPKAMGALPDLDRITHAELRVRAPSPALSAKLTELAITH